MLSSFGSSPAYLNSELFQREAREDVDGRALCVM